MKSKRPTRTFLTRGPTHEIDEAAQLIFLDSLPRHWIKNELKNDYGKDYHVELTDHKTGKVTGETFYVQLKGSTKVSHLKNGTFISPQLSLRHLTYWCDEVKRPVLLVVVDIILKKAYWLLIQQYLKGKSTWRSQKSSSVTISSFNDVSKHTELEVAVKKAVNEIRLTSVSTLERLAFDVQTLEEMDPGLKVEARILGGKQSFHLKPIVPRELKLIIDRRNNEACEKLERIIKKGGIVEFAPEELTVIGSPIFAEFYKTGGTFEVSRKHDLKTIVSCFDQNEIETFRSPEFPSLLEGGIDELHFTTNLARCPVQIKIDKITKENHSNPAIHINININIWGNQNLLQLSYFDSTHRFLQHLIEQREATMECFNEGTSLLRVKNNFGSLERLRWLLDVLDTLKKGRELARYFRIDPILEISQITQPRIMDQINLAHEIVFKKHFKSGSTTITFNFDLIKSENASFLKPYQIFERLFFKTEDDFSLPFLGTKLSIGPVYLELFNVQVSLNEDDINEFLLDKHEMVNIPFTLLENGSCTIRYPEEQKETNTPEKIQ